jgi:hypothetical protein
MSAAESARFRDTDGGIRVTDGVGGYLQVACAKVGNPKIPGVVSCSQRVGDRVVRHRTGGAKEK